MKVRVIIITSITMFLFLFFLIISSSFENIYVCNDEYIILDSLNGNTKFTFHSKNGNDISGVLEIIDGKISFVMDDVTIATALYSHDSKKLLINGIFDKKKYKNINFKQVTSLSEYLITVF